MCDEATECSVAAAAPKSQDDLPANFDLLSISEQAGSSAAAEGIEARPLVMVILKQFIWV